MKTRLFSLLLITILAVPAMTGCQAASKVESAGRSVERGVESIGDTLKQAVETTTATTSSTHTNPALSLEEAQSIALKHAGFTADQVTALHTEYEIEHGIPQYDVEFHYENGAYDYEIHGDTGEILSYEQKRLNHTREGGATASSSFPINELLVPVIWHFSECRLKK